MATVSVPSQIESLELAQQPSPMTNTVVRTDCGIGDNCEVTIECNGKLFEVLLSIGSPKDSIERKYLGRMDIPLKSKNDEELDSILEELYDLLAGLCQPWFKQFTGVTRESTHPYLTLHDCLYLEVFRLQMTTVDGKPKIALQNDAFKHPYTQTPTPNSLHKKAIHADIPAFKSSEIEVFGTIKRDKVFKVSVQGSTMCAKVIGRQSHSEPVRREILSLQRIREANLVPRLRVPTLLGLVVSEDSQDVIGFLMDYIEAEPSIPDLSFLNIDSIPQAQRDKWGNQIDDDIKQLHSIGVVWGDAKAANILLDMEGNPWLVDFGGSWTDGWVDAKLAGSKRGDLQGLRRILEFLCVKRSRK